MKQKIQLGTIKQHSNLSLIFGTNESEFKGNDPNIWPENAC